MSEKSARKKVFDFSKEEDRAAFVVLIVVIIYVVGTVVAWFLLWLLGLGLTIFAGIILFFAGCVLVSDWVKHGSWFE